MPASHRNDRNDLRQVLREAPLIERTVLLLSLVEELEDQDVATICDCTRSEVITIKLRAKRKIREAILRRRRERAESDGTGAPHE